MSLQSREEQYQSSRRQFLKDTLKVGGVATGATTLAGCIGRDGDSDDSELFQRVEEVQALMRSELPWGEFDMEFVIDDLDLTLHSQPTEPLPEDASRYNLWITIPLANVSDDLDAYLEGREGISKERLDDLREEFIEYYEEFSYDFFKGAYLLGEPPLQEFTAPNQPSHRPQIERYVLRVEGESCTYVQNSIPGIRMDDLIVEDPDEYEERISYDTLEKQLDTGFFGYCFIYI